MGIEFHQKRFHQHTLPTFRKFVTNILFSPKYFTNNTTAVLNASSNKKQKKILENICKNFMDTEYHQIDEDFNTAVKLFDNLQMEANGLRRLLQS